MKKKICFSIFIISVFIFVLLVVIKNCIPINVKNPNSIGNDTNNIMQGINISIQDDYVYYSSLDGLFKSKIGSNKKTRLARGDITDINVVGKWIYYVKLKSNSRDYPKITRCDLYRMTINGTQKKLIIKDAYNVNVIDNKIFYIHGYGIIGAYNGDDNIQSLIVSDLNGNNKQTIIEKDVDSMLINDNYIYYFSNDKLFVYDMRENKNELLSDEHITDYILNDENIIFYNKESEQIKKLNVNKKDIEVIVNNVKTPDSLYVNNGILYYTDIKQKLYAYDLNKNQSYEISKDNGDVLFYYDKIFVLTIDNKIKMIDNLQ